MGAHAFVPGCVLNRSPRVRSKICAQFFLTRALCEPLLDSSPLMRSRKCANLDPTRALALFGGGQPVRRDCAKYPPSADPMAYSMLFFKGIDARF